MARRDQVVKRLEIETLKEQIECPELIHVRTCFLVHGRNSTGSRCPCCGSTASGIIGELDDLELLIDTSAGTRDLRHESADVTLFDEIAAMADVHLDVPLRCSELGLRILRSEARTTVGQGASRSSKTQHGVVWAFRQWMLRGGPTTEAIFVGPELRHAHLLLQKWAIGEGESPAVCPRELIVSFPTRLRQEDQTIRMIDGTVIHLLHAKGDGRNLAGLSPAWINGTEMALVKEPRNWAQLRTRVVTSQGRIYLDAVPEAGSWFKPAIIDPARREEEEEAQAQRMGREAPRRNFLVLQMAADDNPWNAEGEGAAAIADISAIDPRLASRYGQGEWVGNRNKTFAEYIKDHHRFEYEGFDTNRLGLIDITRSASQSYFVRPTEWILGVDVNANPHSALICKIAVRPEDAVNIPPTMYSQVPRDRWVFVFFDYVQCWGMDSLTAAGHIASLDNGRYKGAAVVMDASACYTRHNAGAGVNRTKGIVPRKAFEDAGFVVRAPDRSKEAKPQNPRRSDSAIVCRRLLSLDPPAVLINGLRCAKVLEALRDQESEADGLTPARASNTWADAHIIAATDTFRYVTWPFARIDKPANTAPAAREFA